MMLKCEYILWNKHLTLLCIDYISDPSTGPLITALQQTDIAANTLIDAITRTNMLIKRSYLAPSYAPKGLAGEAVLVDIAHLIVHHIYRRHIQNNQRNRNILTNTTYAYSSTSYGEMLPL